MFAFDNTDSAIVLILTLYWLDNADDAFALCLIMNLRHFHHALKVANVCINLQQVSKCSYILYMTVYLLVLGTLIIIRLQYIDIIRLRIIMCCGSTSHLL